MRIAFVAVLFLVPLALSIAPGFPAHGYGHVLYVLPLLVWLERPERTRRIALYLLAVALQVLAFPEPDLGFLGWVLLLPYFVARDCRDGAGWWRAAYFFGFFRALVGYSWLGHVHYTAWIGVALASGLLFSVLVEGLLRF
ncbi:MAG: hypothetical protein OER88_11225, partial [Planctomycetota bacterium]|nr:hypothetical protein [Planctomycetota bacterium]